LNKITGGMQAGNDLELF